MILTCLVCSTVDLATVTIIHLEQGQGNNADFLALTLYKSLYRVEAKIKDMTPGQKYAQRQRLAVPL